MDLKKISKYFFWLVLGVLSLEGFAGVNEKIRIIESGANDIVVQVQVDSLELVELAVDGRTWHRPTIAGLMTTVEPGKPELPMTGVSLAIPPTGPVHLDITASSFSTRNGITVVPVSEQVLSEQSRGAPEFILDQDFYRQDTWYPAELAKIGATGFIRQQRVAQVQICPVQYNPVRHQLRIYQSLTFRLNLPGTTGQLATQQQESPVVETSLEKMLLNYESGKKWRQSKVASLKKSVHWSDAASFWYRIYVKDDGVYRITPSDLRNAGIDPDRIDARTLKIFNRGQELAIYGHGDGDGRFDDGDYFEFYGRFNRGDAGYLSPYSVANVYWLTWDGGIGLRMLQVDNNDRDQNAGQLVSVASYLARQYFEQDNNFDRLLLVPDESRDHWFWQTLNARSQAYDFNFSLHDPAPGAATAAVRVMLHGSTHPSANPDHHVLIKMNGYVVGDASWDGQTQRLIENVNVPNGLLKHGDNVLSVEIPGDTRAGEVDQVFFNWFELDYWRQFQAVADVIEFEAAQNPAWCQFEVHGFRDRNIGIIDNNGRRLENYQLVQNGGITTVIFQDRPELAATTYCVFSARAIKKPEKIVRDLASDLQSPNHGADYIIITHEQFREAVLPLAEHRRSRGLRVEIVDIQDIYDEFTFGVFDPRAIQQFLQYAYDNWTRPAPLYVLLVGDATWTYDKAIARSSNKTCYIPTIMKYTLSWGMTSSDNSFACVSGADRLPDLFIGRLPVNNVQEAESVINKIIRYEQQPEIGDWRKKICLACGDNSFFEESAQHLYDEYIPRGFDVPRLYTNPKSPYFGSTEELVNIFNNGVALLNFIGHGGGGVFFDAELFLLEDVVLLNNATRLPIIFSLTCFIGYFDNPWTPSLGEELLRAPGKGVVATFGSAGRAWLYGDYHLNNALFESLFTQKIKYLGQVTTEAKWLMVARSGSYWDHVENYNLLGDPALSVGFPPEKVSLNLANPALQPGDSLQVQGKVSANQSGQVKLTVFDAGDSLIAETICPVTGGDFSTHLAMPGNTRTGQGMVRAYFWNDTVDGIGTAPLALAAPCFNLVDTEPAEPGHQESTHILSEIVLPTRIAPAGPDSVYCNWTFDQRTWYGIPMRLQPGGYYQTQAPIQVAEGIKVSYKITVVYTAPGQSSPTTLASKVYSYTVKKRADLLVPSPGPAIGGIDPVQIDLTLKNNGEMAARSFTIQVFDGDPNTGGRQIGTALRLDILGANQDTSLTLPWPGHPTGHHTLYGRIDPENQVNETDERNNLFVKPLQLLTVENGTGGPVASADGNFAIDIPAHAVTFNTSFDLKPEPLEKAGSNYALPENFQIVALANGVSNCYTLELANKNVCLVKSFSVKFLYTAGDSVTPAIGNEHSLKIYSWHQGNSQWIFRTSQVDTADNQVVADITGRYALFGLFANDDMTPPHITVKVQDQQFVDGDIISSHPTIAVVLQDESGIDRVENPVLITVDAQPLDSLEVAQAVMPNAKNSMLLTCRPALSPGRHELMIQAMDLAGNKNQAVLNFIVSDGFNVQAIANHPNPFSDATIIAYTLTEEAEEVTIRIYTVSGRLIRSFNFTNEMGYLEHTWDGLDEFGDEVANGVYYLRFEARRGQERIERIEKMARLK